MRILKRHLPYMAMERGCKVVQANECWYISKNGIGVVIYPNGDIVRTDTEFHLGIQMKVSDVVKLFNLV